jgi:hypothetical protein
MLPRHINTGFPVNEKMEVIAKMKKVSWI